MIYLFQELDLISNELLHQMIFSLPVARREYVQHFKLPEDQKRSALAWLLLRYGLKQEYGFPGSPGFPADYFRETIFPWGKYAVF